MLFKDGEEWGRFAKNRLLEIAAFVAISKVTLEAVFVINETTDPDLFARDIRAWPFGITLVIHEENHIPKARNISVDLARGELVLAWDDDDALLTPERLGDFIRAYSETPVGVLCASLVRNTGELFHPQAAHLMPQAPHPDIPGLLLTGMQHTPFVTQRWIASAFPLSETRRFRGEWVEWSSRLWRAGLPIGYLPTLECSFRDTNCGRTSATRRVDAFTHAATSILALAYEYDLSESMYSSEILYSRYAERELRVHSSDPRKAWKELLDAGRSLQGPPWLGLYSVEGARQVLSAWLALGQNLKQLKKDKERAAREAIYDVPPFGLFDSLNADLLQDCIQTSRRRLEELKTNSVKVAP